MLGPVNVSGSDVGTSCVAIVHAGSGRWIVTRTGRCSRPRAYTNVAGGWMCACTASKPGYVPSARSANSVYVTVTVPSWPVTSHP